MDAARASPCGSPCNGLRSRMLQPTCKFRSGQGSNSGADTPAGAPIPLDQSNLVRCPNITSTIFDKCLPLWLRPERKDNWWFTRRTLEDAVKSVTDESSEVGRIMRSGDVF
ncbi:unnamed protein product [Brassica napus]|uniref:(rape) hypothetical protein n=1 Tax=Brassica napus TaxID=3708 RepID=A0A816I5L1_BRANA|nr:unnamed protein product [Brassica napus]